MGVHDGHRERLKETFKANGLDSMSDVNSLELLLFYAIPRRDTNEIAHALIERFGSLSNVFKATVPELCDVKGVGESTALLIRLIPEMLRKCEVLDSASITKIKSGKDAGKYFVPRFQALTDERALLLCLDSQKRILGCYNIGDGVINSVNIYVRKAVEIALKNKAASVILAHNHPDSTTTPSNADNMITEKLSKALKLVDIHLDDHIVVSGKNYVSYVDAGLFFLLGLR